MLSISSNFVFICLSKLNNFLHYDLIIVHYTHREETLCITLYLNKSYMNEEKEKPVLCFSQKRNLKITNQSLTFSLKMRKQLLIFVLSISLAQGLYFGHKRNPVRSSNIKNHLPRSLPPKEWRWDDVSGMNYLTLIRNQHIPQCKKCFLQLSAILPAFEFTYTYNP